MNWADQRSKPLTLESLEDCLRRFDFTSSPYVLWMTPQQECSTRLLFNSPRTRPIDFDSWRPAALVWRPLRCSSPGCMERLSRNCAKRYGSPYCGPHWPGDGASYRLKTRVPREQLGERLSRWEWEEQQARLAAKDR